MILSKKKKVKKNLLLRVSMNACVCLQLRLRWFHSAEQQGQDPHTPFLSALLIVFGTHHSFLDPEGTQGSEPKMKSVIGSHWKP